jgi:hypothetical protein
MKTSLLYPKIPEDSDKFLSRCIAFEKYDGTNMHWEWDSWEKCWVKFGTRRTEFSFDRVGIEEFKKEHSELANAPQIFNDFLRDKLTQRVSECYEHNSVIVFAEFYGPNSFAGGHEMQDQIDNTQQLILFDVMVDKKLIPPESFLGNFAVFLSPYVANVIYTGKYNGQFTEDVRKGKYKVNEGVVCKGIVDGDIFMTKVKTLDYLRRLKQR